jgi:hypothetical protein
LLTNGGERKKAKNWMTSEGKDEGETAQPSPNHYYWLL